jgi:inner membrane transporter RhtA
MCVATLVLAPFGMTRVGAIVHDPFILLIGFGVAILSSVIPFSLELEALRRISARAFGILMSLDPAVAALIGLVVLGETVSLRSLIAMTLIIVASGGVSFVGKQDIS